MKDLMKEASPISTKRIIKIMKYSDRIGADKFPVSLQVALTDACFNECSFCDHWKRINKFKMEIDPWLNFMEEAKAKGLESICYVGGDAFAYPLINRVLEKHIELDIAYGFITTGNVPRYIDMNLLKKARWIRCSLDSVDEKEYKEFRGGVSLPLVLKGILGMKENGCNVEIQASPPNESSTKQVIEFCKKNDLPMNFIGTKFDENNIKPRKHNFDTCSAVYYQLYIGANGDVYPCCHLSGDIYDKEKFPPLGNIFKGDWIENRNLFSTMTNADRPDYCKICGERFQVINHVSENITTRSEFF